MTVEEAVQILDILGCMDDMVVLCDFEIDLKCLEEMSYNNVNKKAKDVTIKYYASNEPFDMVLKLGTLYDLVLDRVKNA